MKTVHHQEPVIKKIGKVTDDEWNKIQYELDLYIDRYSDTEVDVYIHGFPANEGWVGTAYEGDGYHPGPHWGRIVDSIIQGDADRRPGDAEYLQSCLRKALEYWCVWHG